jgi:hypothetical protein
VRAVVTFFSRVSVRIDVERVIRASLHTGFAPYAAAAIEIDYAVVAFEKRRDRAYGHAGSVFAVVAPQDGKVSSRIRVLALLYVLHPGAKGAKRNFVFGFACDRTGMAPDTFAMIDYESVFHTIGN